MNLTAWHLDHARATAESNPKTCADMRVKFDDTRTREYRNERDACITPCPARSRRRHAQIFWRVATARSRIALTRHAWRNSRIDRSPSSPRLCTRVWYASRSVACRPRSRIGSGPRRRLRLARPRATRPEPTARGRARTDVGSDRYNQRTQRARYPKIYSAWRDRLTRALPSRTGSVALSCLMA